MDQDPTRDELDEAVRFGRERLWRASEEYERTGSLEALRTRLVAKDELAHLQRERRNYDRDRNGEAMFNDEMQAASRRRRR